MNTICFMIFMIVIIMTILYILYDVKEMFKTPDYNYDIYKADRNMFRNYYRTNYLYDKEIGWKPKETWEYLTPPNNEIEFCIY